MTKELSSFTMGKLIDATEAQLTLDKRTNMASKMQFAHSFVNNVINEPACKNYYADQINGYLFDKKELIDFLQKGNATHVVIVMGAHLKDEGNFMEGAPTVMVLKTTIPKDGEVAKNGTLEAQVDGTTVALEHPPGKMITSIVNGQLTFNFI
ncbi:MAG TPA: hypothetical protein VM802_27785 [Chitinophaga sp.]|uniref:hypothetical protein n=1 Tax=Chitinophaga sp. TaxID=1869181 RepID=UPI002D02FFC4|nr:hypothetical protein [Chitinophaga sp.]HVI48702.1 hypothetical protein [Chitinophaga sp.]